MASTAPFLSAPDRKVQASFTANHPDWSQYSFTLTTGATTGLSAGDTVMSFRTGTGTGFWLPTIVAVQVAQVTAFGAAKVNTLDLYIARSFTASDTGGVAATLTGNNGKSRTADASTTIADFRVANTATLTAGTRTLDAQRYAFLGASHSTTANASILARTSILAFTDAFEVLAANEGLIVQVGLAYPATGTWTMTFNVQWQECPNW